MYLRRNRVRCGESRRIYLSIAHNAWWPGDGNKKAQCRPIIVAHFGVEDQVDVELARDLVAVVERCAPMFPIRRGEGKEATMRIAEEIRKIEPFLKVLVSRKFALAQHLPPHPARLTPLEVLIRDKLNAPADSAASGEEAILSRLKDQLAV